MRAHTLVRTAVIGFVALAAATSSLLAFCNSSIETYAIFQCGQRAYFAPVPSPFTVSDVTGVFWQLGFGNATLSTGLGTDGTGFASKAFNGNDSGSFPVDFLDAAVRFPLQGFPANSVCLGSNNWGNSGVDGCCDNPRPSSLFPYTNYYSGYGPYDYNNDDNILNPYFGTFQNTAGFPGYFSIASIMDYPTAVLARLPGDAFFAVAAVTNTDRISNFDPNDMGTWTGDCHPTKPGTNVAACDPNQGDYRFSNVTNGAPNMVPTETGKNNVIPWQVPPVPTFDPSTDVQPDPNDPNRLIVDVSWSAPAIQHDGRAVASNNPTLDTRNPSQPSDPNAAPGVGVLDIMGTFGLVRYEFQFADIHDPLFTNITQTITCPGDPACPTAATTATLNVADSECVRIRTLFGTPPRETTFNADNCRLGKCGDIGYGVNGARACFSPCDPIPGGEQCNGLDEDCDVEVDEDFNLGGPCNGIGECGIGVLECQDLSSVRCSTEPGGSDSDPNDPRFDPNDPNSVPFPGPTPDLCDSLDNDCDVATDEDFTLGGTCTGVGECAVDINGSPIMGSIECSSTDPNSTQCSTDPGGTIDQSDTENCDTLDNDCDGGSDESFNLGAVCDGAGVCGAGTIECDPNAINAICSTEFGGSMDESNPESCDALDNDCDTVTDEDFQVGLTCDGVGACGTGIFECSGPAASICSTDAGGSADQSATELCDSLDNDCDASTDEIFILGASCDGAGECGTGITECIPQVDPNTTFCSTDPGGSNDQSVAEICSNGFDEDCDGQTDELGGVEVCDGADNDCDPNGAIDNGFNIGNACTGFGVCGAGTVECDPADPNAMNFCSTMPGGSQDASSTEICDGLDNDCDLMTDEDFMVGQLCDINATFGVCCDLSNTTPLMCEAPGAVRECSPLDPFATICSTSPGGSLDLSIVEVCGNGPDDDCDNQSDAQEFTVGVACNPPGECGVGDIECDPNGGPNPISSLCSTGPGGSDADPNDPRFALCTGTLPFLGPLPEICDGLDNDCNSMTDEGSALPCEVFAPVEVSAVDCTDPRQIKSGLPPSFQMRWHARNFDVFRPQIAWDPGFAKKQTIQSFVTLPSDFWVPNGKQWRRACAEARKANPGNPVLYYRVLRTDLDLPKGDPGREDVTPVVSANPFYVQTDLSVTKDDGQSNYAPMDVLTYTIKVSNIGFSAVTGVTVTDVFPAQLTNVTWTCVATTGAGICPASGTGNLNESVNLPAGALVTFTVTADILGTATGSIVNTASVSLPVGMIDPDTCNNSATDIDLP